MRHVAASLPGRGLSPGRSEREERRMLVLGEAAMPVTRLVELPGRGTTRVWECAGPPGAGTLMLIHGVAGTAELNWGCRRSRYCAGVLLT